MRRFSTIAVAISDGLGIPVQLRQAAPEALLWLRLSPAAAGQLSPPPMTWGLVMQASESWPLALAWTQLASHARLQLCLLMWLLETGAAHAEAAVRALTSETERGAQTQVVRLP